MARVRPWGQDLARPINKQSGTVKLIVADYCCLLGPFVIVQESLIGKLGTYSQTQNMIFPQVLYMIQV